MDAVNMAEERSVTHCRCDDRHSAHVKGEFLWSYARSSWYFSAAAPRKMTPHAKYFAFSERAEYRHEDHTGEPFEFFDCPFCGMVLPGCEDRDRQADGSKEVE